VLLAGLSQIRKALALTRGDLQKAQPRAECTGTGGSAAARERDRFDGGRMGRALCVRSEVRDGGEESAQKFDRTFNQLFTPRYGNGSRYLPFDQ
jgi:hypothetical protein